MAGHMGNENVTVQSLRIVKVDRSLNLIYVRGTLPGPSEQTVVRISDALLKHETESQFNPYTNAPPFPTRTTEELQQLPVEIHWTPSDDVPDPVAKRLGLQ